MARLTQNARADESDTGSLLTTEITLQATGLAKFLSADSDCPTHITPPSTVDYLLSELFHLLKFMNLYQYKSQPRPYRQCLTAVEQLSTVLLAAVDAQALWAESLEEVVIGFADEFAHQLHHNRTRLWSTFIGNTRSISTTCLNQATFNFYALQCQSVVKFMGDGKALSMQIMLLAIRAANPQAKLIVLIWDNAHSHLDRQV